MMVAVAKLGSNAPQNAKECQLATMRNDALYIMVIHPAGRKYRTKKLTSEIAFPAHPEPREILSRSGRRHRSSVCLRHPLHERTSIKSIALGFFAYYDHAGWNFLKKIYMYFGAQSVMIASSHIPKPLGAR